jgi:hypothetical protein
MLDPFVTLSFNFLFFVYFCSFLWLSKLATAKGLAKVFLFIPTALTHHARLQDGSCQSARPTRDSYPEGYIKADFRKISICE